MDSFDRFEETELPSQDAQIQNTHHDSRVWHAFKCETMADYHGIYLQLDVLLLADFFEKFCKTCLEFYPLDPIHYYTTPGLAWDAALRMSHVDLQFHNR